MLHFIGFLEFIVGLVGKTLSCPVVDVVVLSLALVLNYDEGFSGWPLANILMLTAACPAQLSVRLICRVPSASL